MANPIELAIGLAIAGLWLGAVILGLPYLLGRRYLPARVPDLRLRRVLPAELQRYSFGWPIWIFSFAAFAWVGGGEHFLAGLILVSYVGYRGTGMLGWLKGNYRRIVEDDDYVLPFDFEEMDDGFDGHRWKKAVGIDKTGSIGVFGATRSGKTELMKTVVYQMSRLAAYAPSRLSPTFVVYERKDDWKEFLSDRNVVRLSGEDSTHIWNLFLEAEKERDFDVMARLLFPKAEGDNRFFSTAARQLFAAVCKYLQREFDRQNRGTPTNADLVAFFKQNDKEAMFEALSEYDDHAEPFTAAKSALDPDSGAQAPGVYASVQQEIKDTFIEDFAKSPEVEGKPAFSFREFNNEGGIVLLDHDPNLGDAVDRVFRFFIDRSIRLGIDQARDSYFVLDEFAQIPHLRNIGELMNVGAGENVYSLVALQSKSQLVKNYDESTADTIVAGMVTQIFLRLNDSATINHAREIIGTSFEEYTAHETWEYSHSRERRVKRNTEKKDEEEHPFAKGDFTSFDEGVCVVNRPDGWAHGYVPMLPDVQRKIDRAYGWDEDSEDSEESTEDRQTDSDLVSVIAND